MTWRSQEAPPQSGPISPLGWARLAVRGAAAIAAMVLGLSSCAIARLIEIVFRLPGRPCGPWVSKVTYRVFLAIMRVRLEVVGAPMSRPGAIVSNHVSWIDILALGTASRSFFVAKAEVARWPIIGLGASLLGTAFVTRSRADAAEQRALFEERLRDGHRLVFFPEGTSTDGHRVLPFKSTLFAAFFSEQADPAAHMQPVTVTYHAPEGEDPRHHGWWGDMGFGAHMIKILSRPRNGAVRLTFHPPTRIADFPDRKALAAHAERAVREGMPPDRRLQA